MELNARVDVVGRDHNGNEIHRIEKDGKIYFLGQVKEDGSKLDEEPPLRGTMLGGLNKAWLEWYRFSGQGHTLREALNEAKRRIGIETPVEGPEEDEPEIKSATGHFPSAVWIKWYQSKNKCLLREALEVGKVKLNKLKEQEDA